MKRLISMISLISFFCALGFSVSTAEADSYPDKTITIINTVPAGGGADITNRVLLEDLEKNVGVKMIVVNKPGGSDTLGTDIVVRSKKDGYTIGYGSSMGLVYVRVTKPEIVPYDPTKDLDFLGIHAFYPIAVAVKEDSPWKTFGELIDYAKANPGKLRVGTSGIGSTSNFDLQITQSLTGAKFTHVPLAGGPAVISALLGGHVEVSFDMLGKFTPYAQAGKLRPLVTGKKLSSLPNVPTMKELGYKQDLLSGWLAMFAPAGVPEEVNKVLVPAIKNAVNSPEGKAKLDKMGFVVDYKSPEETRKLLVEDYETAMAIAVKIGLRK